MNVGHHEVRVSIDQVNLTVHIGVGQHVMELSHGDSRSLWEVSHRLVSPRPKALYEGAIILMEDIPRPRSIYHGHKLHHRHQFGLHSRVSRISLRERSGVRCDSLSGTRSRNRTARMRALNV